MSLRPRLRFSSAMRLKQSREFARVRSGGQRSAKGCLIANWMPSGSGLKLGVITSKKVGTAVARARARRLLREAFRLHQHEIRQPLDLVLVARPSISGKAFTEVERDFLSLLRQANLMRLAG